MSTPAIIDGVYFTYTDWESVSARWHKLWFLNWNRTINKLEYQNKCLLVIACASQPLVYRSSNLTMAPNKGLGVQKCRNITSSIRNCAETEIWKYIAGVDEKMSGYWGKWKTARTVCSSPNPGLVAKTAKISQILPNPQKSAKISKIAAKWVRSRLSVGVHELCNFTWTVHTLNCELVKIRNLQENVLKCVKCVKMCVFPICAMDSRFGHFVC